MKDEVLTILSDFSEQRISIKEFGDIFYKENDKFEVVLKGESGDEVNHNIFYSLLDLDFNSQTKAALYLVRKYFDHNKIEVPVTDGKIKAVEEKLGHALPKAYVNFLENYNENYFEDYSEIPIHEPIPDDLKYYLGDGFWKINSIYKISLDENDEGGILYGKSLALDSGLPDGIIPLEGDGHTWVAFDYRDNAIEPKIIFIESGELLSFKLANNFSELISKLLPYDSVYNEDGDIIYKKPKK